MGFKSNSALMGKRAKLYKNQSKPEDLVKLGFLQKTS